MKNRTRRFWGIFHKNSNHILEAFKRRGKRETNKITDSLKCLKSQLSRIEEAKKPRPPNIWANLVEVKVQLDKKICLI